MTQELFDTLAAPFPADAISWRVGSTTQDKSKGMALAYLDARDVMDRLDFVCGPAGWQCRYSHANGKTVCDIGVRVIREPGDQPEWIWKADGAGDTDVEAEKGALSDAFKRSAVRWGIGRYLYGLPSPWVAIEPMGRSFKIKDSEHAKLRTLLNTFTGGAVKSSYAAKKDGDWEFFRDKLEKAETMEELGAVGREIKTALPMMPAAMREPLQEAYAKRRDEIQNAAPGAEMDEAFRGAIGSGSPDRVAGDERQVAHA